MSFLFPLALLAAGIGGLVVLAHALFRGPLEKTEFFGLRFVPRFDETTRSERRIDDRWLLGLRLLWILAIALLGAGPFVRCERLGVATSGDGSPVALVLDDSASMAAGAGDSTRFSIAQKAVVELLESLSSTEPVVVVLAGAPPRLLGRSVGPSAELVDRVRALEVTDRGTALAAAVALATSSSEGGAGEPRVFVLSDGASSDLSTDEIRATFPVPELAAPRPTCAVDAARVRGSSLQVEVACQSLSVERRRLEFVFVPEKASVDEVFRAEPLATHEVREGKLTFPLPNAEPKPNWVRLTEAGDDLLRADDRTPLAKETRVRVALVGVDLARGKTSDAPLVELGLRALSPDLDLIRLPSLFSSTEGKSYAAVVLEDPAGLTDDESTTLEEFVRSGGVALALFGNSIEKASLGRGAFPFVDAPPSIETFDAGAVLLAEGVDEVFSTWSELGSRSRVRVALSSDHRTLVRFSDDAPLLFERSLGEGVLLGSAVGPAPEASDFALRPAFLALLERVLREAEGRRASEVTSAGMPIPVKDGLRLQRDEGRPLRTVDGVVTPDLAGHYQIVGSEGSKARVVERPRGETIEPPRVLRATGPGRAGKVQVPVDLTRPLALGALLLGFTELLTRTLLRRRRSSGRSPSPDSATSAMGRA